jgi:tetratricopeptide (TPR) repeat protein
MSTAEIPGVGSLPVLLAYHINVLCDRHEAAWRAGRRPRIEDVLALEDEPGRTVLLRELLAAELAARRQRGEEPDISEYRNRFPGDTALIEAVFAEADPPRTRPATTDQRPSIAGTDPRHDADRNTAADGGTRAPAGDDPVPGMGRTVPIPSDAAPARRGDGTAGAGSANAPTPAADGRRRRYRILRPHARGGLGEVFVAFDDELRREVALKAILPEHAGQARSRARFLIEAEVTGRLEHPGIIPIYGLDRHPDGRPYYAMRLVQGHTLKEAIARFHGAEGPRRDTGERAPALRQLLRRFLDVCNALAYAHSRGVLHRDLKPANILLGPFGETLIVDWGLAKPMDLPDESDGPSVSPLRPSLAGDSTLTQTGSALGTPGYMSPEQAAGRLERLGPTSDVYSLGATLYCILTGRAPIAEREVDRALQKARDGDFPPPRQVQRDVDAALEAICLKAMARDPEDRYPSAIALAEDLEHWLADEPVSARREPMVQRVRRWGRRHRTAVSVAAVAVLAGVVGLAAVTAVQVRSNAALRGANEATRQALDETRREKARAEESLAQSEAVRGFLVEVFRSPDPDLDGRQIKVAAILDRASQRLDQEFRGSEATRGALLDALGRTYMGLGLPDGALKLMERARAVREDALGVDHPDSLETRIALIRVYDELAGRTDQAIELGEATRTLAESKLGPDHPLTLESRINLANAYRAAGRLDEAIPLHEGTLRLFESMGHVDEPEMLACQGDLADAYIDSGRTAAAIAMYQEIRTRLESKLGPDHRLALFNRANLANAYRIAGRMADAIVLYEDVVKGFEWKLGPDHPDTLKSRIGLALAYHHAGRTAAAIPLNEATLRRFESKLGPEHPETLAARNNLAKNYLAVGRAAEALALLEPTWTLSESKLGPDHPDTLTYRSGLASAYLAVGRTAEAIELEAEALTRRESKLGVDHPHAFYSRHRLANAYLQAGRTSRAIALHEETLRWRESKQGPDHPDTLQGRNDLASAYEAVGRWSDAEALRRDVLARRRAADEPDSLLLAGDLAGLGRNLLNQQRWSESEPLLRECLRIREGAISDDWQTSAAMSLLGGALLGQGRYAEAEPLVVAGWGGMKAREARISVPNKYHLYEAAERVVRLYEGWSKADQATAWKVKLGLTDLPADVFAPALRR